MPISNLVCQISRKNRKSICQTYFNTEYLKTDHANFPLGTPNFRGNSQIYLKTENLKTDHAATDAPGRDAALNQGQRLPTCLKKYIISLYLCLYMYLYLYLYLYLG